MDFHRLLSQEIRRSGKNITKIAKEVGISHSYLSLLLSGKRRLSLDIVLAICKSINIPPTILFAGISDKGTDFWPNKDEGFLKCIGYCLSHNFEIKWIDKSIEEYPNGRYTIVVRGDSNILFIKEGSRFIIDKKDTIYSPDNESFVLLNCKNMNPLLRMTYITDQGEIIAIGPPATSPFCFRVDDMRYCYRVTGISF